MKIVRIVGGLCLLLVSLLAIYQPGAILAQDEAPPEKKIELTATYPKLEATSGAAFEFEVDVKYEGSEPCYFELLATGPKDWNMYITKGYEAGVRIKGMTLEPGMTYGNKISVHAAPAYWLMPDPGEYKITVEARSDEISATKELTAVVASMYILGLLTADGLYNISATAGEDNHFLIKVENWGFSTIERIILSSERPRGTKGWVVSFSPDEIDSLAPNESRTVDVTMKLPSRTIAGDYYPLELSAEGEQAEGGPVRAEPINIRITVETPTIWGWVGFAIILAVIGGLVVIFMRFSRR